MKNFISNKTGAGLMDLDDITLNEIGKLWYHLMTTKSIYSRTIFNRIPKDRLSKESLENPKVAAEISRQCYYDVVREIPDLRRKALDVLVKLGYVEKHDDTIYFVNYTYVAHPYLPFVLPSGIVGITSPTQRVISNLRLESKQYANFEESAKTFRVQIKAGKHRHIPRFDYGIGFQYETTIYEIKDRYFDAIFVNYDEENKKLIVHLTEPFVQSFNKRDHKNWRQIKEIDQNLFLSGSAAIDKEIDSLEWKKKLIGIILYNDEAYFLSKKTEKDETEDSSNGSFRMPNFLDEGGYSYENYLSRIFEDAVADYLRQNHQYDAVARTKPPYLEGKELDVFAEKGLPLKNITVCECKFRPVNPDSPITISEVQEFGEKAKKVEEHHRKSGVAKFWFWLVTNTDKLEEGVDEYSKKIGIEIKKVHLPKNWKERSDWSVVKIENLKG